jgi:uncharacterized protein YndB with AHSA1/START domain
MNDTQNSDLEYFYVTVINAAPEKVWEALTTPEFTAQYWHQTRVHSEFRVGAPIEFFVDDDRVGCEGEILVAERPRKLSYTWSFPGNPEVCDEAPSRVTFVLEPLGSGTKLIVCHDRFPAGSIMYDFVTNGWPLVLSGLKTLLETGQAVDFSSME